MSATDGHPEHGRPTVLIESHVEMSSVVGSGDDEQHEVDAEWWYSLTEEQQEAELSAFAEGHLENVVAYGAHVIETDEA